MKTYRDVLDAYKVHPEPKSLGPDGKPCGRATRGLLRRRPVTAISLTYIGKESNRLEDVQSGLVHRLGDVLSEYGNRTDEDAIISVIREMPLRILEETTGLSRRQLQRIRSRGKIPRRHAPAFARVAADWAREQLTGRGMDPPKDDRACLFLYRKVFGRD